MAPADTIIDDPILNEESQPADAELARGLKLTSQAMMRKKAEASEKALKGLYVDWAFDKLNLTEYR